MAEKRNIPTAILLSLTTEIVLSDVGDIRTAAEFILGYPILSQHFACDTFWSKIRAVILEQHPDLTADLADDVDATNWESKRDELVERFGETREMAKGDYEPELGLLDGIPEGKKTIIVEVSKDNDDLQTI